MPHQAFENSLKTNEKIGNVSKEKGFLKNQKETKQNLKN